MNQTQQGYWSAVGCYTIWGVMPIYMRLLKTVPATQIVTHRIVWSCIILLALLHFKKSLKHLFQKISWKLVGVYTLSALCVATNWLLYVYGTNHGQVTEVSLGYFINPLINVLLGVLVLRERLRAWQMVAVLLASVGVAYLGITYGSFPWIALGLGFSFGFYGLIRKMAPLGASQGLTLETLMLLPIALLYLSYLTVNDQNAFGQQGLHIDLLLIGAGLITTVPLLMFNHAAQRISLTLMGVFQYIGPTLQFLVGVFIYDEPVSHAVLTGFMFVWSGLVVFALEGAWRHRRSV